jgi:hypothetical protein
MITVSDFTNLLTLADCDAPVSNQALVRQLIRGFNPKFNVLKTLLYLLPRFPTFIVARDLVLSDETSRDADIKRSNETTLLAASAAASKTDAPTPTQPPPDRTNTNYNNNGDRGHGHGCGGGRGHSGHNGGRDGGRNNNSGHAPQWQNYAP